MAIGDLKRPHVWVLRFDDIGETRECRNLRTLVRTALPPLVPWRLSRWWRINLRWRLGLIPVVFGSKRAYDRHIW